MTQPACCAGYTRAGRRRATTSAGQEKKMAPDTPIRLTVLTPRARLFPGPVKPCRASTKIAQSTTGRIVHLPGTGNEAAVSTVNTVSGDADCDDACPGAAGLHC